MFNCLPQSISLIFAKTPPTTSLVRGLVLLLVLLTMLSSGACKHASEDSQDPSHQNSQLKALHDTQYSILLKSNQASQDYYFYICHKLDSPDSPTSIISMAEAGPHCTNLFRHVDNTPIYFKLEKLNPLTPEFNPDNLSPKDQTAYNASLQRIQQEVQRQIDDALKMHDNQFAIENMNTAVPTGIAAVALLLSKSIRHIRHQILSTAPPSAHIISRLSDILLIISVAGTFEIFKFMHQEHQQSITLESTQDYSSQYQEASLTQLLKKYTPYPLLIGHYPDLLDNNKLTKVPSIPKLALELANFLNVLLIKTQSSNSTHAIAKICLPQSLSSTSPSATSHNCRNIDQTY